MSAQLKFRDVTLVFFDCQNEMDLEDFLGAGAQSLDLPDDEFNYDEFVQREFGKPKRSPKQIFWWVVAVALLIASLFFLLHR